VLLGRADDELKDETATEDDDVAVAVDDVVVVVDDDADESVVKSASYETKNCGGRRCAQSQTPVVWCAKRLRRRRGVLPLGRGGEWPRESDK